jgi:hypothetical protein
MSMDDTLVSALGKVPGELLCSQNSVSLSGQWEPVHHHGCPLLGSGCSSPHLSHLRGALESRMVANEGHTHSQPWPLGETQGLALFTIVTCDTGRAENTTDGRLSCRKQQGGSLPHDNTCPNRRPSAQGLTTQLAASFVWEDKRG